MILKTGYEIVLYMSAFKTYQIFVLFWYLQASMDPVTSYDFQEPNDKHSFVKVFFFFFFFFFFYSEKYILRSENKSWIYLVRELKKQKQAQTFLLIVDLICVSVWSKIWKARWTFFKCFTCCSHNVQLALKCFFTFIKHSYHKQTRY